VRRGKIGKEAMIDTESIHIFKPNKKIFYSPIQKDKPADAKERKKPINST
jgi:hypothetical protein